jgi:hypothetical protein
MDTKTTVEALDRGELVRLLADVEAGVLEYSKLEKALEYRRSRWRLRRFLTWLVLGR